VGGELARAAFDHGFEKYGVEILSQYSKMIAEKGETYLWYFPDGTPSSMETSTSPDAEPTDGWGSSAMLYALVEGLAGIEDLFKEFRRVKLAPRWHAAQVNQASVKVSYAISGQGIQYNYILDGKSLTLDITGNNTDVSFHILIPCKPKKIMVNGIEKNCTVNNIEESVYADFQAYVEKQLHIVIDLI
jgi:hypothetical protein